MIQHFSSRLKLKLTALLLIALCGLSGTVYSDDSDRLQKIKAAFIYNIAKFVSWSDSDGQAQLQVCYFRSSPAKFGFDAINGKRVHNLKIIGREVGGIEQADGCNILFIPETQLTRFNAEVWLQPLDSTLTIADMTSVKDSRSQDSLALINLVRQGARIGLEIDPELVQASPLHISSELLKIARIRR